MLFQLMSPDDCVLSEKRVDVWQIPLSEAPSWAYSLLNADEQAQANRYHFPRHQRRFIIAHALLRVILAKYLNADPRDLEFTQNTHGKPYLANNDLQFNLSHSKDSALIGVGKQHELGIDLEYFSERSFIGIAEHVFSTSEISALTGLPPKSQQLAFFNIWAQKEAFIKAVGMGLSYPLKQFSVPAFPKSDCECIDLLTQKTWRLISVEVEESCSAAVCVTPQIDQLRRVTLKSLIEIEDTLSPHG